MYQIVSKQMIYTHETKKKQQQKTKKKKKEKKTNIKLYVSKASLFFTKSNSGPNLKF